MGGYVGVTAKEWFSFLSKREKIEEVNFWRKDIRSFKALKPGESFYFLVKNEPAIQGERPVLGKATYNRFEVSTVNEAWNKYGIGNGDLNKHSFLTRMNTMFEIGTANDKIGCIILSDFISFETPVYLSEINIKFNNAIVSGKGISIKSI